jgi:hypothetical protein
MAAPTSPASDPIRDLATRMYVELICKNVTVTDNAVKITTNPENLAKICFKLADAFQRAEYEIRAASMPKNQEYDLKASDLTGLMGVKPDK